MLKFEKDHGWMRDAKDENHKVVFFLQHRRKCKQWMMKNGWNLTFYVICTNKNVKESLTQKWRLRELLFSKQIRGNEQN